MSREQLEKLVIALEEEMYLAAEELRFEYAAKLRDGIKDLRRRADRPRRVCLTRRCSAEAGRSQSEASPHWSHSGRISRSGPGHSHYLRVAEDGRFPVTSAAFPSSRAAPAAYTVVTPSRRSRAPIRGATSRRPHRRRRPRTRSYRQLGVTAERSTVKASRRRRGASWAREPSSAGDLARAPRSAG